MSTDLMTGLADYGQYHRETQEPIRPGETAHHVVRSVTTPSHPNYALRRAGAAMIAAALVIVALAIPAWLRGPADPAAETTPLEVPSTMLQTTTTRGSPRADEIQPPPEESRPMVQVLGEGIAVAIGQGNVWRTEDFGENWEEWYAQSHEIHLLATAPDGALIAVQNPGGTSEALGDGSVVNETPEVHRYDPSTKDWFVIPLPRPELPGPGLAAQEENIDECALSGLQSFVTGLDVAVGDQIVILGEHRVVGVGICDEAFPFLWISPDGVNWSLGTGIGVDGYFAGIVPFADGYVAYGSQVPSYVSDPSARPKVWTSTDLDVWVEHPLDLLVLPDEAIVEGWAVVGDGPELALVYEVRRFRPGLESVSDIDGLKEWVVAAGWTESAADDMEEWLHEVGIDFPLDEHEFSEMESLLDMREPFGTLILTTGDGTDWEATYSD